MTYTNSQISLLIDEYIHSARDRRIMKLHYVDGLSADVISRIDEGKHDVSPVERIDLMPRQINRILSNRLLDIKPLL